MGLEVCRFSKRLYSASAYIAAGISRNATIKHTNSRPPLEQHISFPRLRRPPALANYSKDKTGRNKSKITIVNAVSSEVASASVSPSCAVKPPPPGGGAQYRSEPVLIMPYLQFSSSAGVEEASAARRRQVASSFFMSHMLGAKWGRIYFRAKAA
jgi:hypothetical protein